jgi:carbon-monoxide dehydrogenase large subunit
MSEGAHDVRTARGSANLIGAPLPRQSALPLLAGRGCYVDDISLPRMLHVAFLRSPHAHARIHKIHTAAARDLAGVSRVVTGADLKRLAKPYVGVLLHMTGMKAAAQYPLAVDRATWQGEPVAAVAARTRAEAEDAVQAIEVDWEPLPALTDTAAALLPGAPLIHPELGDNILFAANVESGKVDDAFGRADRVIELSLVTDRHTAVPLETRGVLADFNRASGKLTVHQSTQTPFMMQALYARLLGLPEHRIRVQCKDVGGGFGGKIHIFGDELCAVALAVELGRPVKFIADRLEAFVADVHSRGHELNVRIALASNGEILAVDVDDVIGVGPYSMYPRGSVNEARHVVNLSAGCYRNRNYRARSRVVLQNKAMYAQYRAVGHPIACLAGEVAIENAARVLGVDSVEIRRRNLISDDAYPYTLPSGIVFERLSLRQCLDTLVERMNYQALRAEQQRALSRGCYRGIGFSIFVENSNHFTAAYGRGGAPIASQDGCYMRVDGNGAISVGVGVAEMGQGATAAIAQIAAAAIGVSLENINMVIGDTELVPYGAGNWGSRGTGIAGEATWQAGRALRDQILAAARVLLDCEAAQLDIRAGNIVDAATGRSRMSVCELAREVYFRPDHFPQEVQPELAVTRHFAQKRFEGGIYTNGAQASYVEVDVETGQVQIIRHWAVDDCGVAVNPLLVEEQIRGGIVQGIGHALYESCLYDPSGQLANGSLIDYLVPMSGEMPDIDVAHVSTPTASSALGAKGAGEAGVTGAPAAVLNAINDALAPFRASVSAIPATPERVLRALAAARRAAEPRRGGSAGDRER